jgi:hypothetical protein
MTVVPCDFPGSNPIQLTLLQKNIDSFFAMPRPLARYTFSEPRNALPPWKEGALL